MRALFPLLILLAGCWRADLEPLDQDGVAFAPASDGPEGWVVRSVPLDLQCPDGEPARLWAVHPDEPTGGLPVAVVFHSGAFDYLHDPELNLPLPAETFQVHSRLSQSWAARRVFTTLGMFDDGDPIEVHDGSLVAVLAESGRAVLLPENCWGDWWHNQRGLADNATSIDGFTREGRAAALAGWRAATEPSFASGLGLELTLQGDAWAIGLGEGGRAVGALLADGYLPAAALVDAHADDLGVYWADPELYGPMLEGLDRIIPGGPEDARQESLGVVPNLPQRVAYLYSSRDGRIPIGAHALALARLGSGGAHVEDVQEDGHVFSNRDRDRAVRLVNWLGTGSTAAAPEAP